MAHRNAAQLNIRSTFARQRVRELARRTGMTVAEVVEDALRGYVPPSEPKVVGRLVHRGPLLVRPVGKRRKVTLADAEAALEAVRGRDP